ncbi:MAG: aminoacyl-tRNA hydrolase [Proteobacteria bacterium]|nr:aminoacyl-tRNA hydrolase [Pseudomonadota bacterium]
MIQITPEISLEDKEVALHFIHASGPGGQNVNKVSTAVQLRFDVINSPSLSETLKARIVQLAGGRVTGKGVLIINARRFRTQERNREDAFERLAEWIRMAGEIPKKRRKTAPTKASRLKRLEGKTIRSQKKRLRRGVSVKEEHG